MTQKRGRYIDGVIEERVKELALEGWTAGQIYQYLNDKSERNDLEGVLPSQRTIQRVVADVRVRDTTGVWRLADSDGEDARCILDVLGWVIRKTNGGKRSFTRAEAQWVLKIYKAAPGADLWLVWLLARLYMIYESEGRTNTGDLDAYLAMTPWKDAACFKLYKYAVEDDWVEPVPLWSAMVEVQRPDYLKPPPEVHRMIEKYLGMPMPWDEIRGLIEEGHSAEEVAEIYKRDVVAVEEIAKQVMGALEKKDERTHKKKRKE